MPPHVTVWVGGRDCTGDTIAELTIKGGRSDVLSQPDAVTVSLSIEWPDWAAVPVIGDGVQVLGWVPGTADTRRALFAGQVTDVALEGGVVSLLAVDPSRRLDGVTIGDAPWDAEKWYYRVERVAGLAAAAAGADWFGRWTPPLTLSGAGSRYVAWRDVDRQPVLQLIEELFAPYGMGWWYMPDDSSGPSASDPGAWRPATGVAGALGRPTGVGTLAWGAQIPAWMVDGEPGPRLWMNLDATCNEWIAEGPICASDGKPGDDVWTRSAALPAAARDRFGPSSRKIDSGSARIGGLEWEWEHLAGDWLDRLGYPTWSVDGVSVLLDAATVDRDGDTAEQVWRDLLRYGPGACGLVVRIPGLSGSVAGDGAWVVEGMTLTWLEDGWQIDLDTLTDLAVYKGKVAHPPVDPRNAVSLAVPVPPVIGPGGVLLQPLLHAGGVQGATGGVWRVVAPDLGAAGPEVVNRGLGTLVPTPALPPGTRRLVVQWLAAAGSTVPAEWLEVPVVVERGRTWREAAGTRWRDAVWSWRTGRT